MVLAGVTAPGALAVSATAAPGLAQAASAPPGEPGEASEEARALDEAAATGRPVEVTGAATETQTVMANPDGTLTLSVAAAPVRTKDPKGELVDIDPTLQRNNGRDLATTATPRTRT